MIHCKDWEAAVLSTVREFAEQVNCRGAITADMSSLVSVTDTLPLNKFDYWERLIRWKYAETLRSSASPSIWPFRKKTKRQLTWIDLASGNGYEREKTLRAITGASAPNSFFFVLVLRRLNDWVLQVRMTARETVPEIANNSEPKHVAEALCAILPYWNSWGRLSGSDREIFFEILAIEKISEAMKNHIISATNGPISKIFSQVGRIPVLDSYLDEIAQSAIQPSVRAKAYRSQLEGKISWFAGRRWKWTDKVYGKGYYEPIVSERVLSQSWPLTETLKRSSIDKSPIVRRVAGELLIGNLDRLGSDSLELATMLASDASHPVSERGKFALRKLQEKREV